MGNMNKVSIVNESRYDLQAELISQCVRVPIHIPYNKKVEFQVSSSYKHNVVRVSHNNGDTFGSTFFNANSDDSDSIQITNNGILFNGKLRFEQWNNEDIQKWINSAD